MILLVTHVALAKLECFISGLHQLDTKGLKPVCVKSDIPYFCAKSAALHI